MKRFICFLIIIYTAVSGSALDKDPVKTNYPSGSYNQEILLELKSESFGDIFYNFGTDLNKEKTLYKEALHLTAMCGEKREYKLNIFIKKDNILEFAGKFVYIINKKSIESPRPILNSGIYRNDIEIDFGNTENTIYYTLSDRSPSSFVRWNGEPITVRQNYTQQNITLAAYCEDKKGNSGQVVKRDYIILPAEKTPETLKVYSPVEGSYLNSQLLYIDTTGFKWIRYSIGSNDPAKFGTTYRDPVLFKAKGDYVLNIAGLPENSTGIIKKTVKFSIKRTDFELVDYKSGVYSESLQISITDPEFRISFNDNDTVSEFRESNGNKIVFSPITGLRTYNSLRIASDSFPKGSEYRYFYVFNREIPGSPVISYEIIRENKKIKVDISSKNNSRIYYTYDGTTPDKYSILYKNPFYVPIGNDALSGSVIIKAVCISENGLDSSPVAKLITYDYEPPGKPEIRIEKINSRKYKITVENSENNRIFYLPAYDGDDPGIPDMSSFHGEKNMFLKFPAGVSGVFRMNAVLVDNFGNISDPTGITIPYDTSPPLPPEIRHEEGSIKISGKGKILYSFDKSSIYNEYKSPILEEEIRKHHIIRAYIQDDEGYNSKITEYSIPSIIKKTPDFKYFGVENNKIYNKEVVLKTFPAHGTVLFYSVKTNDEFGEKKPLPSQIIFDCPENTERHISLRIFAERIEDSADYTETNLDFIIDRKKPKPPVFTSVKNMGVYNHDVILNTENTDNDIWLLIKQGDIEDKIPKLSMFYNEGIMINGSYTISGREDEETKYTVYAAAVDKAGNFTVTEKPVVFIIDFKAPSAPEFRGIPTNGKANKDVLFSVYSENAADIYYTIEKNGKPVENMVKRLYTSSILLPAYDNEEAAYVIKAWTIDKAGNKSRKTSIAYVNIYRKTISVLEPEIFTDNDNFSVISFPVSGDLKVFYKIGKSSFTLYKRPFIVRLRNNIDYLYYYSVDSYLNKSEVIKASITVNNRKNGLVIGIRDNEVYNRGITVRKRFSDSSVYYELTDNEDSTVTVLSPQLDSPLNLDSSDGQVHSFVLKVREFNPETLRPLSDEEIYRITIDKENPSIPTIAGVENKNYYQNSRNITISSSEGTVFYELFKNDVSLTNGFKKYSGVLKVDVNNGNFAEYRVSAYSRDKAGNRSPVITAEFAIDKAIVYLSSNGKDSYDGTRTRPLRSLETALSMALNNGRKVIYATVGEYGVNKPLLFRGDITVIGGFGIGSWNKSNGRTVVTAGNNHFRGDPVFDIESGNITFENCTFTNLGLDFSVIEQNGGNLNIKKCELIFANGRGKSLIRSASGNLEISDSDITVGAASKSIIFPVSDGSIKLKRVEINVDGAINKINIFNLKNSLYSEIENLILDIKNAQVAEVFNLDDSSMKVKNSIFDTGNCKISSQIFTLRNSALTVSGSTVRNGSDTGIISILDGEDSTANIYHSVIDTSAKKGISVFKLIESSLNTVDLELNTSNTSDFTSIIRGTNSEVTYKEGKITLGRSYDPEFIYLKNSMLTFDDNTVDVFGKKGKSLVSLTDMVSIEISGCSFKNKEEKGTAFFIIKGNNRIYFLKNSFTGWSKLMEYNGLLINDSEELNTFSGFSSSPYGNSSK